MQLFHSFVRMKHLPLDYKGVIMVKGFLLQEKTKVLMFLLGMMVKFFSCGGSYVLVITFTFRIGNYTLKSEYLINSNAF